MQIHGDIKLMLFLPFAKFWQPYVFVCFVVEKEPLLLEATISFYQTEVT